MISDNAKQVWLQLISVAFWAFVVFVACGGLK